MGLHDRQSVRHKLEDGVYASKDLATGVPRCRFPTSQHDLRDADADADADGGLGDELMLKDMRDAVHHFDKHAVEVPMDATEATDFHH